MAANLYRTEDKIGLVGTAMLESYPIGSQEELKEIFEATQHKISIAGFRYSQGGHTLAEGGQMLTTETFARPIAVDRGDYDPRYPYRPCQHPPNVTVAAGTLWSQLHHVLCGHGLAPRVHQSSSHFSVGGSISVNCHGRDPREGPIGNSVNWLEVWTPKDGVVKASRQQNRELFSAVVGGYGSCGVILKANLALTPNLKLEQVGYVCSLAQYAKHLEELVQHHPGTRNIHLHYGWLKCTSLTELYGQVLCVDFKDVEMPQAMVGGPLEVESWGQTELMRAGWAALRQGYLPIRRDIWNKAIEEIAMRTPQDSRLNWLRAAIGFTSYRGVKDQDILQEYFVPLDRFEEMAGRLRDIFRKWSVNVLSTTVRLVRPDGVQGIRSNLSYAPDGERICIAVDLNIPVDEATRKPAPDVRAWIAECLEAAQRCKGTYYLPYYPFASRGQFREFYPGHALQTSAIGIHNPQRRLQNMFMQTYL